MGNVRFKDKIVLIHGGNSGMGLASAEAFAREGAQVIITGRNARTLAEAEIKIGHGALARQADITDFAAQDRLIEEIRSRFGRIDVLFVNAGIGHFIPTDQVTEADFDLMMNTNFKGPYFAVQKAVRLMGPGGSIVLTSSIGHAMGLPGNSVYAAAKSGLRSMARCFGVELVGRGIRVNCFSPGPIDTPLITRSGLSDEETSQTKEHIRQMVPMKRWAAPEEAAGPVLFLASDDASFITGVDLFVDGGIVPFGGGN